MSNPTPIFPRKVAKAIVQRIDKQVGHVLQKSQLSDCNWEEKSGEFQLFEKIDIQLGKRLGSGGFSDVYEVKGFNKARKGSWSYTFRKDSSRKKYKKDAFDKDGKSKYVVKQLKISRMQDPKRFCKAGSDLVMEALYLSMLHHKNILTIRGWAAAGVEAYLDGKHDGFFLILDRLEDTLDKRLERWSQKKIENPANSDLSLHMSQMRINDDGSDLISRVKISHQIASAVQYLHSKNIIFRDLKPNNVGFDEHGTVKIFDFGLCREMPEELENVNDVYKMSGRIGTLRYMAPEVALLKKYNQKVDTYSWALIFWYCLSLKKPYPKTTRGQHLEQVCQCGVRPALDDEWSDSIQYLLEKSWAQNPYKRFTMLEVCAFLERIENELENGTETIISSSSFFLTPKIVRRTSNTVVPMAA